MAHDTILIIDDHALFRSGIVAMLSATLREVTVHESASLDEGVAQVGPAPRVVLLDIQLQGANGLDGIALLKQRWPETQIVVVSANDQTATVDDALARGAVSFLSKSDRPERMIAVLSSFLKGPAAAMTSERPARPLLTPRQKEVLDLVGQGLSNKMIGRRLGLSEHTVRGHVQALLTALGASRRAEAVFEARKLGLIR